MLDFEQYKKEQDEAEAAYEAELRKKKPHELTPEEIGYLADQNEAFVGKTLNKGKLAVYEMVCRYVAMLLDCDGAIQTVTTPPDKSSPHAMVSIDFKSVNLGMENDESLDGDISNFMSALSFCDHFYFGEHDGVTRFSFLVKNIWEK